MSASQTSSSSKFAACRAHSCSKKSSLLARLCQPKLHRNTLGGPQRRPSTKFLTPISQVSQHPRKLLVEGGGYLGDGPSDVAAPAFPFCKGGAKGEAEREPLGVDVFAESLVEWQAKATWKQQLKARELQGEDNSKLNTPEGFSKWKEDNRRGVENILKTSYAIQVGPL